MNLLASFHNDPFFSGVELPRALALERRSHPDDSDRRITQHDQRGDTFGFMQSMMNNMNQMMASMNESFHSDNLDNPRGHGVSFSSSTMMSMDGRNPDQPRIIQATSETLRGPEGK